MATVVSTAWDTFRTVASLCFVASVAGWIVEWRRGRRTVRDEHGRLKPAAAVAVMLAPLVALGVVGALIDLVI